MKCKATARQPTPFYPVALDAAGKARRWKRYVTDALATAALIGDVHRLVHVVDDDASVRKALGRLLASVGIRVASYESARRYLELVDVQQMDCLVLDLHLPGMSGIELLEHLRAIAPELPVVCMTGAHAPDLAERLVAAGEPRCLRKPFDESELFDAIAAVTGVEVPGA